MKKILSIFKKRLVFGFDDYNFENAASHNYVVQKSEFTKAGPEMTGHSFLVLIQN